MRFATRTILILTLILAAAMGLDAQENQITTETTTETTSEPAISGTASEDAAIPGEEPVPVQQAAQLSGYELRNQFSSLLRRYPRELSTILVLDPSLISNEPFLAGYPEVQEFVAANPVIRRNPTFYLGEFRQQRESSFLGEFLEGIMIFAVFALIAFALAWAIRTIIEQKRWNRLSRSQSEVHNKILDRFSTSEELLAYVRTPAGTKFLESAPIPLHTEQPAPNAPLTRVIWSVQLGVVIAAGAMGMLLVSIPIEGESGQALFTMGVIGFCVGVGFIASAAASVLLSRKLGAWQDYATPQNSSLSDPGQVR